MNKKTLIRLVCPLWFVATGCLGAEITTGEVVDDPLLQALKGRWEGTINGTFRSQDVSWRFEADTNGRIRGFMGPTDAGMPELPMENLILDEGAISFDILSQHGHFEGRIGQEGIQGSWKQDFAFPLAMRKRIFAFILPEAVGQSLLGRWTADIANTPVSIEFTDAGRGLVTAWMDMPARDLFEVPLVDLFVTEDGYMEFATDNGRRFSGRLVNGVLVGQYQSRQSWGNYAGTAAFLHEDRQAVDFDLNLTESGVALLLGTWRRQGGGGNIVLQFSRTAAGKLKGHIVIPGRAHDPLLEVIQQEDRLSFQSLGGRAFSGTITDQAISGMYRVNNFPYEMTFDREVGQDGQD